MWTQRCDAENGPDEPGSGTERQGTPPHLASAAQVIKNSFSAESNYRDPEQDFEQRLRDRMHPLPPVRDVLRVFGPPLFVAHRGHGTTSGDGLQDCLLDRIQETILRDLLCNICSVRLCSGTGDAEANTELVACFAAFSRGAACIYSRSMTGNLETVDRAARDQPPAPTHGCRQSNIGPLRTTRSNGAMSAIVASFGSHDVMTPKNGQHHLR
jgi:hypothetical protein